jgi:hypothetical protein
MLRRSEQIDSNKQRVHNYESRQMDVQPDPGTSTFGGLGSLIFVVHDRFLSVADRAVS